MQQSLGRRLARHTLVAYAGLPLILALALWVEILLARAGGSPFHFLAISIAVVASACAAGFAGGALALLLTAVAADYYLLDPGSFLTFGSPAQGVALAAFTAGWLGVCWWIQSIWRRLRMEAEAQRDAVQAASGAQRLLQLSTALMQARTQDAVIEAAVQEPMHVLQADAGLFLLTSEDGSSCTLVRAVAWDPAVAESEPLTLTGRSPVRDAIDRRAPVIVASRAAWRADYPDAGADVLHGVHEALAAVPLIGRGRVVAVIVLAFTAPRTFTAADEEFLLALGSRAAQALDRMWRYEYAQRARLDAESLRQRADQELAERQKTEVALRASETRYRLLATRTIRLHELTAALSEAVTLGAVAKAVVQHGNVVVGATAADVSLLVDGGQRFQVLYAEQYGHGVVEPRQFEAAAGLCATDAVERRRPIFIGSWPEWQDQYWESASVLADAAYVSSAVLPLLVESAPIGVLSFHFSVPVNFDDEYRALLVSVAQHCAQALDRARLYESAERARSDAETASRLKDDFLSIVSHELRTPLNAVLGWASMLQKGSMDPALATRAVQSICDNATRQAKLIDELLDLTRIVAGHTTLDLQEIRIAHLIGGVAESVMPAAAARQVDLRVGPTAEVVVRGDLRRLEQVLFNLLSNALKFTPPGGRIELDAHVVDSTVELRVADNGVGIDPDFLPHAFDRFRQQDSTSTRSYGGLGLGLSIAKQLVEAHGGSIAAESAGRNTGATFSVRLPLAGTGAERARHPEPAQREPVDPAAPRLDGIRVLVVDDEADAREVMGHALRSCGATVDLADSAAAALDVLVRVQVDVLLADIAMPNEDGCSLMRRIRAFGDTRVAAVPAAAVTAHARDVERHQAYAAGFQLHLAKPVDPMVLARTVEQLVRGTAPALEPSR